MSHIFKKGRNDDPGNYQPVSLTSVLGKIMEFHGSYDKAHERQKGEWENQHGFTKGICCLINLAIVVYDGFTVSVDKRRATDVIYLDINKAFVMVPHNILFSKSERHGFDRWTVQSTRNWLRDCVQRAVVNGSMSS